MNEDIIKGKWTQLKGDVQKKWAKLTNDKLDEINGDRTKLLGEIQEVYGIAREEAEEELRAWEKSRAA